MKKPSSQRLRQLRTKIAYGLLLSANICCVGPRMEQIGSNSTDLASANVDNTNGLVPILRPSISPASNDTRGNITMSCVVIKDLPHSSSYILKITVTNNDRIYWYRVGRSDVVDFPIWVLNGHQEVPLTAYGAKHEPRWLPKTASPAGMVGTDLTTPIPPGQKLAATIDLSKLFEIEGNTSYQLFAKTTLLNRSQIRLLTISGATFFTTGDIKRESVNKPENFKFTRGHGADN